MAGVTAEGVTVGEGQAGAVATGAGADGPTDDGAGEGQDAAMGCGTGIVPGMPSGGGATGTAPMLTLMLGAAGRAFSPPSPNLGPCPETAHSAERYVADGAR